MGKVYLPDLLNTVPTPEQFVRAVELVQLKCKNYAHLELALMYGSAGMGQANPLRSDIDLLLVSTTEGSSHEQSLQFARALVNEVWCDYGVTLQLRCERHDHFGKGQHTYRSGLLRHMFLVAEQGGLIQGDLSWFENYIPRRNEFTQMIPSLMKGEVEQYVLGRIHKFRHGTLQFVQMDKLARYQLATKSLETPSHVMRMVLAMMGHAEVETAGPKEILPLVTKHLPQEIAERYAETLAIDQEYDSVLMEAIEGGSIEAYRTFVEDQILSKQPIRCLSWLGQVLDACF